MTASQGPEQPEPEQPEQRAITEESHDDSATEDPETAQDRETDQETVQETVQERNQDQSAWDSRRV